MIGAVALTALGALRAGAGLVTFAAPRPVQPFIAVLCPCATSVPLACDDGGAICAFAVGQVLDLAGECDVAAAGPGMGVGEVQQGIVSALLQRDCPLVLDADALNNLAQMDWAAMRRGALVLTPHPGEFARLIGKPVRDVQADRESLAVSYTRTWDDRGTQGDPLVLVLKGNQTVVTDGHRVYVNQTGNPGMATGGTGDVLTGVIAALIGQGMTPFDAACLGVWLHGKAGDVASQQFGQAGLIATDLPDRVGALLGEMER
jgi:NAD(P)H-hydrate epimerase